MVGSYPLSSCRKIEVVGSSFKNPYAKASIRSRLIVLRSRLDTYSYHIVRSFDYLLSTTVIAFSYASSRIPVYLSSMLSARIPRNDCP